MMPSRSCARASPSLVLGKPECPTYLKTSCPERSPGTFVVRRHTGNFARGRMQTISPCCVRVPNFIKSQSKLVRMPFCINLRLEISKASCPQTSFIWGSFETMGRAQQTLFPLVYVHNCEENGSDLQCVVSFGPSLYHVLYI
jgi:hypothetical protein